MCLPGLHGTQTSQQQVKSNHPMAGGEVEGSDQVNETFSLKSVKFNNVDVCTNSTIMYLQKPSPPPPPPSFHPAKEEKQQASG